MSYRKKSPRGLVIGRWENAGEPAWDIHETIRQCRLVDERLETERLNPAPRFREERQNGNEKYVMQWVYGCHFPWLNPRE